MMNLLKEYPYHFGNETVSRLLYFFQEEGDTIPELRSFFADKPNVDVRFSKKVPEDLSTLIIPFATIVVFDDLENFFSNDKQYAEILFNIASVLCHHKGLTCFLMLQTMGIMRTEHKLHNSYTQSTHVAFFREPQISQGTKTKINNFQIPMKGGQKLFDVYNKWVQNKKFAYLMLYISADRKKPMALSNLLMRDIGPMLSHHVSDEEDD